MARKKEHHEEEAGEAWLLPYSDLMTLLLALFIALFAIAKTQLNGNEDAMKLAAAFRSVMGTDKDATGGDGDKNGSKDGGGGDSEKMLPAGDPLDITNLPHNPDEILDMITQNLEMLGDLKAEIDEYFENAGLQNDTKTVIDERGLAITLYGDAAPFDSGSATLKPKMAEILDAISVKLGGVPNNIHIEGHTDTDKINTANYPSNRELSNARAVSVLHLFAGKGIPEDQMVTIGYGEWKPIDKNDTPEGKAHNRRVEIILVRLDDPNDGTVTKPTTTAEPAATTTVKNESH